MLICLMLLEDGDRAAFLSLYETHRHRFYRVALRILKDEGRAQDAVQTALCKMALHFEKIKSLPCLETRPYLVTIVENTAIDMLRKGGRAADLPEGWDAPDAGADPEGQRGYRRIVAVINAMPETYREALYLKFVYEYTDKQVAKALGITAGAATTRISRGRALLIQALKEEGYDDDGA